MHSFLILTWVRNFFVCLCNESNRSSNNSNFLFVSRHHTTSPRKKVKFFVERLNGVTRQDQWQLYNRAVVDTRNIPDQDLHGNFNSQIKRVEVSSFGILRAKFTVISTVLVVILDVFIIINIYVIKQTNCKTNIQRIYAVESTQRTHLK